LKVGKEELVGLLRALELFVEEDHESTRAEWRQRADHIGDALGSKDGLKTTVVDGGKSITPIVDTHVTGQAPVSATELVRALRHEEPRVFVGADNLSDQRITINPMCLTDTEADYVVERIQANLAGDPTADKNTGTPDGEGEI
jgi:L-seryl-tRNA(Ser) seleniumtransferase